MKQGFKLKSLHITVGLFTAFILASCAGTGTRSLPQNAPSSPYKRTLELTVNHPQLQSVLEQKIIRHKNLILQPQSGFSEFHIVVDTSLERIKTLETKPLLMGRIQKTKTPVSFKVHYKINNHTNHTLAQGHSSETTETLARIYPSLKLNSHVETTAINSIADKILKEARSHITVTPWSTRVTAIKDDMHVTIPVGEDAGLELADTFITESKPTAKLQVVMFEQLAGGNQRTILGLVDGFLPQAGRKLIAEK